jgi:aldose 1-epimerase
MMRAGQLYEVTDGSRRAIVSEQGASLVQVLWDGTPLLDSPNDDGFAVPGAHGQILVPWPGRVAGGTYEHEGTWYHLPIDDHGKAAAIHGLARWATWQVRSTSPGRLLLGCRLLATPGYPFPLELEQSYAWQEDRLALVLRATNIGESSAPFGYGCHPYFSVGTPTVDDAVLHVPADKYVPADENLSAAGPPLPVEGTPWDFRQARPIGGVELDLTLTDLQRDGDGNFQVELSAPGGEVALVCTYGAAVRYLQLYSGDTLPSGRRRGLAIEPYTCVPNAFNNKEGLVLLKPGTTEEISWSITATVTR